MPLVSMRQLLDHAAEHGYGIPAFNVNNLEQVQAHACLASESGTSWRLGHVCDHRSSHTNRTTRRRIRSKMVLVLDRFLHISHRQTADHSAHRTCPF